MALVFFCIIFFHNKARSNICPIWHGGGREFESRPVHYLLPVIQLRFALMRGEALKTKPKWHRRFRMNSIQSERNPFTRVKLLGIVFLAFSIVLPLIALIVPESEIPVSTGIRLSWLLILLMPIEILLIYVVYHFLSKKPRQENLMASAYIMYMIGTIPSIYGTILAFIDSTLRHTAILLGLMFSLIGLGFAFRLSLNLWENIQAFNQ